MFDFISEDVFKVCFSLGVFLALFYDGPILFRRYFGDKEDDDE